MDLLSRALIKAGLKKRINYNSVEYQRERGAKIGEDVDFYNCIIDDQFQYLLTIGDHVTITGATILCHDASTKRGLGYTKAGRVTIGSNVFIGHGSIILPNTKIGNKVIIGAGGVIAHDVPDNSVVVGNPCRIICSYDEYMDKMTRRKNASNTFDLYPVDMSAEIKQMQMQADEDQVFFVL